MFKRFWVSRHPWGSNCTPFRIHFAIYCKKHISGTVWDVKTSKWWGLSATIWAPIWSNFLKMCVLFRRLFRTSFSCHFWAAQKVVGRLPVRTPAQFSLSHVSSPKHENGITFGVWLQGFVTESGFPNGGKIWHRKSVVRTPSPPLPSPPPTTWDASSGQEADQPFQKR